MATDGVARREALPLLEGTVFDGRFRIEERIAEGGFAIVYRAWQIALDRRVALKVLKPPRTQDELAVGEFRDRFAVEARTIARLRHPHIVDVYDFAVAALPSGELAPWMALEWLEGETLAMHLGRRRREGRQGRPPREAVEFLRPVMLALGHAHAQGIVHRDVKPSNIMVTETPSGPSLRVLDFGIAKIMVDDQSPNTGDTRTESAPVFSPAYAAPEQVAFSRTGPWTDVHGLGLILTELMTDQPPFSDPDPEAHLFEQVMARKRPTPGSKGCDVGAFEPIIQKALALSPRDRWRTVEEMVAALDGEPALPAASVAVPAPARGKRLTGALAIGAMVVVASIVAARPGVGPTVLPTQVPTTAATTLTQSRSPPAPELTAIRVLTTPAALSPSSTEDRPLPGPVRTAAVPPRKDRRRKPTTLPSPASPPTTDGRELFDDTK